MAKRYERAALELGLSLVSAKLAAAMGVPGSMPISAQVPMAQLPGQPLAPGQPPLGQSPMAQQSAGVAPGQMPNQMSAGQTQGMGPMDSVDPATEQDAELPTTNEQVRDRSAKIAPGRIITTQ